MLRTLIIAAMLSTPAMAQAQSLPLCQQTAAVIGGLEGKYKEQIGAAGRELAGTIMTLHMSPVHGTWTLVRSYPNGTSCVIAAGKDWRTIEAASTDPEA
jgi:hypothetical protein